MSRTVISVQNVGKTFAMRRHGSAGAHQALEDLVRAPFRPTAPTTDPYSEGFWALRNVSFEVGEGEVVGVIGRNGAGKSVLLKLLARVTRPTQGRIEIHGRVAPLLELGAGFHPDLTGRDNIYLNGVILGMRRAEVSRRLDEIVAFADVGGFLDSSIKRFSTGMRMRLAFAIAAFLDRDIFLLDEVLAVGDGVFQEKCLARLGELAAQGRTVLLVSHGDEQMERFCSRALLFDHGRLIESGVPAQVYARYHDPAGYAAA